MICPKCFHGKTNIYNSRKQKTTSATWRRHSCLACGFQFTTTERVEPNLLQVTQNNGSTEGFNFPTLLLSIAKSCQHLGLKNDAYHLSETIVAKLLRIHDSLTVSRDAIYQTALETLENYDSQAYLSYLAAHGNIKSRHDIKAALKKRR